MHVMKWQLNGELGKARSSGTAHEDLHDVPAYSSFKLMPLPLPMLQSLLSLNGETLQATDF